MSRREHGTHACYVHGPDAVSNQGPGCRCTACSAANSAYERERARRIAPAYVGAARARAHIRDLSNAGIGLKRIAEVSGVSHGALWKLVYGAPDRGPSKRIRKETEDRILAVRATDQAPGGKIPAGPTWETIDRLLARGWTKKAIAHALGQKGDGLQVSRKLVTKRNADAIAALLDQPVPARRSRWGTHEAEPLDDDQADDLDDEDAPPRNYELPSFAEAGDSSWMERGACRLPNVETWIFFPGRGDLETVAAAKAVCATCPVTTECAAYAARNNLHGIWGGTSEKERRTIRRHLAA